MKSTVNAEQTIQVFFLDFLAAESEEGCRFRLGTWPTDSHALCTASTTRLTAAAEGFLAAGSEGVWRFRLGACPADSHAFRTASTTRLTAAADMSGGGLQVVVTPFPLVTVIDVPVDPSMVDDAVDRSAEKISIYTQRYENRLHSRLSWKGNETTKTHLKITTPTGSDEVSLSNRQSARLVGARFHWRLQERSTDKPT